MKMSSEYPPKHKHHKPIFKEEAVQKITELVTELANEQSEINAESGEFAENSLAYILTKRQATFNFYVNKFVEDVLAYCHRKDFPEPLIYTVVEMIHKHFSGELDANEFGTNAPLSEVKMDDTTFKFAVSNVDLSAIAGEKLFESIKPKLNLYRKVVGF